MWRSVSAVIVGFLVTAALSIAADAAVRAALPGAFDATGRTDSAPVLALTLVYVTAFAVAGAYLTARLAPSRPMRHALALGVLGLLSGIAGTVAAWSTAPAWYHVLALAVVLPSAWLGGRLRERELGTERRIVAVPPA